MHDLMAQVTSGLLRFPAVTVEALGEDEVNLDSVLHGKFTTGVCLLLFFFSYNNSVVVVVYICVT